MCEVGPVSYVHDGEPFEITALRWWLDHFRQCEQANSMTANVACFSFETISAPHCPSLVPFGVQDYLPLPSLASEIGRQHSDYPGPDRGKFGVRSGGDGCAERQATAETFSTVCRTTPTDASCCETLSTNTRLSIRRYEYGRSSLTASSCIDSSAVCESSGSRNLGHTTSLGGVLSAITAQQLSFACTELLLPYSRH
jgi:hypothetical protein